MFVGHTAVALAAKRVAPDASLGVLVGAAFGLDLLWPVFLLAGLETVRIDPGNTAFTPFAFDSYPWSHSLVMAIGWGIMAAFLARWRRGSVRAAAVVGLLVVSHWVLDAVTHRPDLPLWPGISPLVGLGLWQSIGGTLLVEGALLAAGIALYLRRTAAKDAVGRWALAGLLGLQTAVWLASPWAEPPPDPRPIAYVGLASWLFVAWAGWIDRHRSNRA